MSVLRGYQHISESMQLLAPSELKPLREDWAEWDAEHSGATDRPASAFNAGDKVDYQHGLLGKLDGNVSKITGTWPNEKLTVNYKTPDGAASTVMTTNQAAVKLTKK